MAPTKKGGEKKKGQPAINGVTKEYTIHIHKLILGVGFKKCAPRKFATKEMGTLGVHIDTRLNNPVWANGIRNAPYPICAHLSENIHQTGHTSVTYVPVTAFKNLQLMWMKINC
ncbi:hypothetical protein K5549_012479 [Capra hircus]|nr:hypothetical protein K5549_012479 [Capra hircus]